MKRHNRTSSIVFSLIVALLTVADSLADEKATSASGNPVADRLVTLALEADVEGDGLKREKLLRMALGAAPGIEAPNWHLGRIAKEGQWLSPAEVHAQAASDQLLAKYEAQRLAAQTAKHGELSLARWCTKHGMLDRAKVHYRRVFASGVADESIAEEVAKALELQFVDGAWRSEVEIAQARERAEFIQAAVDQWRPKLEKLYQRMSSGKAKAVSVARESLLSIDDPRVVVALDSFVANGDDAFGEAGIELLSRFREFEASAVLVRFAVLSPSPNVREAATVALRSRPLHHTAPLLINSLSLPIKSQYAIRWNGENAVAYDHFLVQEGAHKNVALAYTHQYQAQYELMPVGLRPSGAGGRLVLVAEDSNRSDGTMDHVLYSDPADELRHRMTKQVTNAYVSARSVENNLSQLNSEVQQANAPIYAVLNEITDLDLPSDPAQWREWWLKHNEVYSPAFTYFLFKQEWEVDSFAVRPQPTNVLSGGRTCFQAGVGVWTEKGLTPIEEVRVGDRVYSQDPQTGELALKLVIDTPFGEPRTSLLRVHVGGEDLFPTLGHDMWVTKSGWRMAKEIAVGDRLHSVNGGLAVEAIENLPPPACIYNLIVEDFNTYFVGKSGVLVHDMTFRRPTTAIAPGLIIAER